MELKKTLASVLAISLFFFYGAFEHAQGDRGLLVLVTGGTAADAANTVSAPDAPSTTILANAQAQPAPAPEQQPVSVRRRGEDDEHEDGESADAAPSPSPSTVPAPTPVPVKSTPTPTPASTPAQTTGQYKDGSYTGSSVNVYYGYVQVKAIISGGKLTDVRFMQYPSDRNTSRYINSEAMPELTREAIAAQSANVSGVSGASATSQGFIESLGSALASARA